jgi:hypothetical protein
MSAGFREQLRESLRVEAVAERISGARRVPAFLRLFARRFPVVAAVAVALLVIGLYGFHLFRQRPAAAAQLSPALMAEAAGDHRSCAVHFLSNQGPVRMEETARRYDPAYADLDRVAEAGAQGLGMQLRSAHLCSFAGRRFAHLVYTRGEQLISLLVTERDGRAMRSGSVPPDDGLRAGLQQALADRHMVSAYQSAQHVVIVVSELSEEQNRELAGRIALPVSDYLRGIEERAR